MVPSHAFKKCFDRNLFKDHLSEPNGESYFTTLHFPEILRVPKIPYFSPPFGRGFGMACEVGQATPHPPPPTHGPVGHPRSPRKLVVGVLGVLGGRSSRGRSCRKGRFAWEILRFLGWWLNQPPYAWAPLIGREWGVLGVMWVLGFSSCTS